MVVLFFCVVSVEVAVVQAICFLVLWLLSLVVIFLRCQVWFVFIFGECWGRDYLLLFLGLFLRLLLVLCRCCLLIVGFGLLFDLLIVGD